MQPCCLTCCWILGTTKKKAHQAFVRKYDVNCFLHIELFLLLWQAKFIVIPLSSKIIMWSFRDMLPRLAQLHGSRIWQGCCRQSWCCTYWVGQPSELGGACWRLWRMKSLLIHRELKRIQHVGSNFKKQISLVAFRCDALQYCQCMSFFTLKLFGPVILMPCCGGTLHFPSFDLVQWSLLLTSFSKSIKQ